MLRVSVTTDSTKVRQFCINHDFFTRGTNQDYDALLGYVDKRPVINHIELNTIIDQIIKHSDLDLNDWYGIREDMKKDLADWFLTEACTIRINNEDMKLMW